ncbi:MAG TPA: DUF2269 family protein [Gaiellaceae bacterium]
MNSWLLFFHLLGAVLFFSGAAVAAVGQLVALRKEKPSEIALLLGLTRWGVLLVGLGALLTIGFGSWIVARVSYWSFDQAWIEWAMALWVASMVVGGLGGRPARHTRELAERLAREGDRPSEELRRRVADPVSLALSFASGAILVAVLVLMVWKPGVS